MHTRTNSERRFALTSHDLIICRCKGDNLITFGKCEDTLLWLNSILPRVKVQYRFKDNDGCLTHFMLFPGVIWPNC